MYDSDGSKQKPKTLPESSFETVNTEGPVVSALAVSSSEPYTTAASGSYLNNGAPSRSVFVGSGGNVQLRLADSSSVVFNNIDDGSILPVRALEFSGSASNVIFLY